MAQKGLWSTPDRGAAAAARARSLSLSLCSCSIEAESVSQDKVLKKEQEARRSKRYRRLALWALVKGMPTAVPLNHPETVLRFLMFLILG